MNHIDTLTIAKLIEAHLEHDEEKFMNYAQFIAETYEKNQEPIRARVIRSRLDGSYNNKRIEIVSDSSRQKRYAIYIDAINNEKIICPYCKATSLCIETKPNENEKGTEVICSECHLPYRIKIFEDRIAISEV